MMEKHASKDVLLEHAVLRGLERYGLDKQTVFAVNQELTAYHTHKIKPKLFEIWYHMPDIRLTNVGSVERRYYVVRYVGPIYTGQVIQLIYAPNTETIVTFMPRMNWWQIRKWRLISQGKRGNTRKFYKSELLDLPQDEC